MGFNRNINMDMWYVFESPNAFIYDCLYCNIYVLTLEFLFTNAVHGISV